MSDMMVVRCACLVLWACIVSTGCAGQAPPATQCELRRINDDLSPGADNASSEGSFGEHRIVVAGPDNVHNPTAWEGPIEISTSSGACSIEDSLVRDIYADVARHVLFVVSYSGATTRGSLIDTRSCAALAPVKVASGATVTASGNTITIRRPADAPTQVRLDESCRPY